MTTDLKGERVASVGRRRAKREALIACWRERGASAGWLAAEFEVDRSTVQRWLREVSAAVDTSAAAEMLLAPDATADQVATRLGCSAEMLFRQLREAYDAARAGQRELPEDGLGRVPEDVAERLRELSGAASRLRGHTPADSPTAVAATELNDLLRMLRRDGVPWRYLDEAAGARPGTMLRRLARESRRLRKRQGATPAES